MTSYDIVLSALNDMTERELDNFSQIMLLYQMCRDHNEKDLFMFATMSYMSDKFFSTFVEPSKNN